MKRDQHAPMAYWNEWTPYMEKSLRHCWTREKKSRVNSSYRPQYVFDLAKKHYELMLFRYSRGDATSKLARHFGCLLDAWEKCERLGKAVWTEQIQYTRHAWVVNLDHYIRCFWLTGLALTLNIPDDQWNRLVALMGNEGEDVLLDSVIAFRQTDRKIGTRLCFPKVYQPLLDITRAPAGERPLRLKLFLDSWFGSLKIAGSVKLPPEFRTPYWWDFYVNKEIGMKGAYFGCWCIEAAVVVKVFGLDDSHCVDHRHYPADLLKDGRCRRYPDSSAAAVPGEAKAPVAKKPRLKRFAW
jgi:hypothetical protein